ncbi:flavin reductase family protein [Flammeovirga sp. SubArs3]|uniref:flavin reductase family protein n=1 Tax=Flammeovirga sp. SubArs3 TaxID=2995316 RepID=UPI00248BB4A1|nr:flavin reductase family protein [Flammeovirga sp. SubArs3]
MKSSELLNIVLTVILIFVLVRYNVNGTTDEISQTTVVNSTAVMDSLHTKKSVGKRPFLFPMPVGIIGSYDSVGTPNIMAASWIGIVNSKPMSIGVSLRPSTKTYNNVMRTQAFTVNIANEKLVEYVDWVGHYSGKDIDKFDVLPLTPVRSKLVNAPYVHEFPVVLECRVVRSTELGKHTHFVGEIMDVKVDTAILKKNQKFVDINKLRPIMMGNGSGYFGIGENLGRGGKVYQRLGINPLIESK